MEERERPRCVWLPQKARPHPALLGGHCLGFAALCIGLGLLLTLQCFGLLALGTLGLQLQFQLAALGGCSCVGLAFDGSFALGLGLGFGFFPCRQWRPHFILPLVQQVAHTLALGVDLLGHVFQFCHQVFTDVVQRRLALGDLVGNGCDGFAALLC